MKKKVYVRNSPKQWAFNLALSLNWSRDKLEFYSFGLKRERDAHAKVGLHAIASNLDSRLNYLERLLNDKSRRFTS
jgi:hypothetical protein